ncbi:mRNA splicing protein prp18 [Clydaea vesicula]|uniref:Pre-mRNA-splicing factor 18 n=1 Tax=Clydaea vesicula TaxID=447962 RepID=A0AAD5TW22_9FUNG|nr:mRNA splicing protein prp18 [Clydaea vesicula]KAJ3376840.1 mRNA splicing protein prp18 [Lobulomyces angularis]
MSDLNSIMLEMKRKRDALKNSVADESQKKPKYLKRGDLEKIREEQYYKEQELERQKKEKLNSVNNVETVKKSDSDDDKKKIKKQDSDEDIIPLTSEEIIKRLRSLEQPVRLFAETDLNRYKRLSQLGSKEERHGLQNEFMKASKISDQQTKLDFLTKASKDNEDNDDGDNFSNMYDKRKNDLEDLSSDIDTNFISTKLLNENPEKNRFLIEVFLKRLTKEWGRFIKARPDHEKDSVQGRNYAATQMQTENYLKPFFKNLRKNKIENDVITSVTEIIYYIQRREYQKANHAYLRLSIGNAAWPIGVTMVGIHERSGREKINSNQIGHVLNDETQRKWIQSLKRLMTFSQTVRPPDDLSKLVG